MRTVQGPKCVTVRHLPGKRRWQIETHLWSVCVLFVPHAVARLAVRCQNGLGCAIGVACFNHCLPAEQVERKSLSRSGTHSPRPDSDQPVRSPVCCWTSKVNVMLMSPVLGLLTGQTWRVALRREECSAGTCSRCSCRFVTDCFGLAFGVKHLEPLAPDCWSWAQLHLAQLKPWDFLLQHGPCICSSTWLFCPRHWGEISTVLILRFVSYTSVKLFTYVKSHFLHWSKGFWGSSPTRFFFMDPLAFLVHRAYSGAQKLAPNRI